MSEPMLRLTIFIGVLVLMGLWEWLAPRRLLKVSKGLRWRNNLGLVVLNTLILRVLFPTATVGVAIWANAHGLGLLNVFELPYWLNVYRS